MFVTTFLYAGLVPLAVAAIFGCVAIALRATPQIVWPLSAALGFIAGLVALKSQSGFVAAVDEFANPHESANWLPAIVGLAAGVSVLLAIPRCRNFALCLAAFLVLAAPIRLLSGNVRLSGGWSLAEKIEYLALLVATFGGVWAALANGDRARQTPARLVFLMITAVGTAAALTLSGVLVYGQACGALAASLAGAAISQLAASWWGRLHAADYATPRSAEGQRTARPGKYRWDRDPVTRQFDRVGPLLRRFRNAERFAVVHLASRRRNARFGIGPPTPRLAIGRHPLSGLLAAASNRNPTLPVLSNHSTVIPAQAESRHRWLNIWFPAGVRMTAFPSCPLCLRGEYSCRSCLQRLLTVCLARPNAIFPRVSAD